MSWPTGRRRPGCRCPIRLGFLGSQRIPLLKLPTHVLSLSRLYWTAFLASNMWRQSRYPFLAVPRIAADRDYAVRRMIAYAFRHVPYYRRTFLQLGLTPEDFRSGDDITKLPVIDAETIRHGPDQFLADNVDPRSGLVLKTSGSSGVSRAVHIDRAAIFRNAAQGERERSMIATAVGKRHGYREAVIVLDAGLDESSTPRVQRFMRRNAYFPKTVEVERMYIDAAEQPQAYLPRLNRFAPDIIQGYGSSFDHLIDHVTTTRAEFHRPRAAYFHSDAIATPTRAALQALGIPVFSTYEACEALKIGFECDAHQGYHVNIDTYPVRIVDRDGRDVPAGETGTVVVSNLSNRAMVLLNYDLGDRARWLPGPCPCGRTLPRLELVDPSALQSITLPSGRIVNPSQLYGLFLGEPGLHDHQIVHVSPDRFRLVLVVPDPAEREACGSRILKAFQGIVAEDATAEAVFVDRIPLSNGGKKRKYIPLSTA